jgi:hypothetical protein
MRTWHPIFLTFTLLPQLFAEHEQHMTTLKANTQKAKTLLVNKHKNLDQLWLEAQKVAINIHIPNFPLNNTD